MYVLKFLRIDVTNDETKLLFLIILFKFGENCVNYLTIVNWILVYILYYLKT